MPAGRFLILGRPAAELFAPPMFAPATDAEWVRLVIARAARIRVNEWAAGTGLPTVPPERLPPCPRPQRPDWMGPRAHFALGASVLSPRSLASVVAGCVS